MAEVGIADFTQKGKIDEITSYIVTLIAAEEWELAAKVLYMMNLSLFLHRYMYSSIIRRCKATSLRFHEALRRVASASCDRLHVVSCDAYEIDFIKVTMHWIHRKFLDNEEEHVVSYDDP